MAGRKLLTQLPLRQTGKSSIINALKRSRAVGVSSKPGFTTSMQEVVLDRDVRLLDSPGIVFDDEAAWLGNCINTETLPDPIPSVEALLRRCDQQSLIMTYSIPAFPPGDVMMFLAMVARSYGRVLKGGIPDKIGAARAVLKDWNEGKIPYYTAPPADNQPVKAADALVLAEFSKEFDALDAAVLSGMKDEGDEMDFVKLNPAERVEESSGWKELMEDSDEEMEEESVAGEKSDVQRMRQKQAKAEDYNFDDL
jgi:nuclear GTP-binding protein